MIFKDLKQTDNKLKGDIHTYSLIWQDAWTGKHYITGVYLVEGRLVIADAVTPEIEEKVMAILLNNGSQVA